MNVLRSKRYQKQPLKVFLRSPLLAPKILKPSVRAVFDFCGKGARTRRVARRGYEITEVLCSHHPSPSFGWQATLRQASGGRPHFAKASGDRPRFAKASGGRPHFVKASGGRLHFVKASGGRPKILKPSDVNTRKIL